MVCVKSGHFFLIVGRIRFLSQGGDGGCGGATGELAFEYISMHGLSVLRQRILKHVRVLRKWCRSMSLPRDPRQVHPTLVTVSRRSNARRALDQQYHGRKLMQAMQALHLYPIHAMNLTFARLSKPAATELTWSSLQLAVFGQEFSLFLSLESSVVVHVKSQASSSYP